MKQIIKNSATSKIDNRLSYTSERYKGYLIVLDRGGAGYNVYDKHRELEDAGYPSKEAAKNFIDELVANDDVYSAHAVDNIESEFQRIDRSGTEEEVAIAAIMYNLGTTMREAREILPTLNEDKIKDYVDYYNLRDLPRSKRVEIWNNRKNISSSSNVKASNDDYDPYSFMVGDQLEWSGLYGGQYKGVVTNVNDEYVTVEVMWTSEDSGDTIIDTEQFEIATDPEGKECIIVWTYGSHAGYVYPPSNDYINSAYEYDADDYDDSIYSSNSSKAFTGYVRTLCNNCGHLNRVKVIFPEFNKPFEDTNYKCESCGAINELTDPHVYDEDGYIISSTISSKLDKIRAKLLKAVHDVMTSSEFGFLDDEVEDYSAVEIVPVNDNMICIEVRAEVDYDGLWMLKEVCDPIIQKYYPDAYFDMETAGVMQAYISKDVPIKSASNDTYYMQLKRAYKNMRKFDDMDSQSADILDLEDELNSHDTPYERYEHTTDNGCTIFYDDYIKGQEFKNSDLTERETLYYKGKKFVLTDAFKDRYGKYHNEYIYEIIF